MVPSLNPGLDNSKSYTPCPMGLCLCMYDCYMMRRSSQTTQTFMSRNHGVYIKVELPKVCVCVCVFFPMEFHWDQCSGQHTWQNSAVDSTLTSLGFRGLMLISRIQIFIGGRGQLSHGRSSSSGNTLIFWDWNRDDSSHGKRDPRTHTCQDHLGSDTFCPYSQQVWQNSSKQMSSVGGRIQQFKFNNIDLKISNV